MALLNRLGSEITQPRRPLGPRRAANSARNNPDRKETIVARLQRSRHKSRRLRNSLQKLPDPHLQQEGFARREPHRRVHIPEMGRNDNRQPKMPQRHL